MDFVEFRRLIMSITGTYFSLIVEFSAKAWCKNCKSKLLYSILIWECNIWNPIYVSRNLQICEVWCFYNVQPYWRLLASEIIENTLSITYFKNSLFILKCPIRNLPFCKIFWPREMMSEYPDSGGVGSEKNWLWCHSFYSPSV